ncbi:MAG: SpoIIE family protein phosphatase [Gammaproteobacteria bacterium]
MSTSGERSLPLLDWGVAAHRLAGQAVSGDLHLVQPFVNGVLVAAVDGLGHGEEAAVAARAAVATLAAHAGQSVIYLVRRCHAAMRGTRGAAMSLASFDAVAATLAWTGVGDVEGVLLRAEAGAPRESLLLRGGIVGCQLPPLGAGLIPVQSGDTLIFATDGVHSGFGEGPVANETPQQHADRLLAHYGKGTDDALVLVARWLGLPAASTRP